MLYKLLIKYKLCYDSLFSSGSLCNEATMQILASDFIQHLFSIVVEKLQMA